MNLKKNNRNLALIDDDEYWINLIKKLFEKEYHEYKIETFKDFKKFMIFEDLNNFDIIITDFYFNGYNLDLIDTNSFFNNFKGIKVLVTGYPNIVNNINIYDKIINKSSISKQTFKFSRHLDNLINDTIKN